jgi:hypothetical protein
MKQTGANKGFIMMGLGWGHLQTSLLDYIRKSKVSHLFFHSPIDELEDYL